MNAGLIAAGVLIVCVLIALFMAYLITRAPRGYQDEDRFHYGEQPRSRDASPFARPTVSRGYPLDASEKQALAHHEPEPDD